MESDFKEAPLGGSLHAWTVCHHPFNYFFFKASTPYIVAQVDMDAGVRGMRSCTACPNRRLKIGLRVKLGFEPVNKEVTLPVFRRRIEKILGGNKMKRSVFVASALAALLLPLAVSAQTDWPQKPVSLVVPYPPAA